MKSCAITFGLAMLLSVFSPTAGITADKGIQVSDATQECIDCHTSITPELVQDWKKSRHAGTTVRRALEKSKLSRRVSADSVPKELTEVAVGCAECHTVNSKAHEDTFDHNDQKVHVTVTPSDCAMCHPVETEQYKENIMSHARQNLVENKLYEQLLRTINGVQSFHDMKTTIKAPDEYTNAESCYHCHGTSVGVKGTQTRDTDFGEMEFPVLTGWPNQGVGRFNPDGSKGTCTPCHSRHQFSIQMARKPYMCSQCHKGPDVPAYQAYSVSKHGNVFSSMQNKWNFNEVPWTVGKDFTAPTCAVCHVSLLVTPEGDVVAQRSHRMNDRLPWRILGLIYSAPHPKSPNTSIIRNKDGLPLPTALEGEWAAEYLIGPDEQAARRKKLQAVCRSCHSLDWVNGHWVRFENTIGEANKMTLTATRIMKTAWDERVADNANLFDEAIEKQWVEQWLFYGNSTRFASAMMGADYGVFANGRWYMAKNIQEILDRLKVLLAIREKSK